MKCLVIDDEPLARDVITGFIKNTPGVEVGAEAASGVQAIELMNNRVFDLIFLDVDMPSLSGIEMLELAPNLPPVILTTAHPEFAVQGFELNVLDYLLKPIAYSRFLKALAKAKYAIQQEGERHISLKSDKRVYRAPIRQIQFVEGLGDYIRVYLDGYEKPVIVQETMKGILEELGVSFLRTHKSYIVNKNAVKFQEGNQLTLKNEKKLPIGHSYRKAVASFMLGRQLL